MGAGPKRARETRTDGSALPATRDQQLPDGRWFIRTVQVLSGHRSLDTTSIKKSEGPSARWTDISPRSAATGLSLRSELHDKALLRLEATLPPPFVRCHRSRPTPPTVRRTGSRATPTQASKAPALESPQAADSDSAGSPDGTTGRPLDLSIRDAAMSFERKPLARQEARISEAPIRTPLAFTDRSFGGMMQRMTRQSICRELRAALSSSPQSASSVMASMREQGCRF